MQALDLSLPKKTSGTGDPGSSFNSSLDLTDQSSTGVADQKDNSACLSPSKLPSFPTAQLMNDTLIYYNTWLWNAFAMAALTNGAQLLRRTSNISPPAIAEVCTDPELYMYTTYTPTEHAHPPTPADKVAVPPLSLGEEKSATLIKLVRYIYICSLCCDVERGKMRSPAYSHWQKHCSFRAFAKNITKQI
ncbi:unnamed protein product [Dibothriocephalus latus]|uniref:Uncharacterized protein n=1 Tax=Dibothriocephalus latus TaxID=60516 RepID=A0A3P7MPL1_DIBLA|nr:unnamed protein product [Dibothriocephalus latus]